MSRLHHPSADYLRQCFDYDSGVLTWKARPLNHFASKRAFGTWNTRYSGTVAGFCCMGSDGLRWVIRINRKRYNRSVLIWAYHHGWPDVFVDHENRNKLDDRVENLRLATDSLNAANTNRKSNNTSGYKGVSPNGTKWLASIKKDYRQYNLGRYDTPEEAHAAYCKAAKEMFGEYHHNGDL